MSKQKKEQQKKKKKEQVRKARLKHYRETLESQTRDEDALGYVAHLVREKKDYAKARGFLLEYVEKHPKHDKPYGVLATICRSMGDYPGMFLAAEKLLEVGRRTLEDYRLYYAACLENKLPSSMLACVELMQQRFGYKFGSGNDPEGLRRDMLDSFRNDAAITGDDLTPCSDDQLLELMRWQEQSLLCLGSQRFDAAVDLCDRLIEHYPFFRSAYNNKAMAVMMDRGADAAEPLLQQAFEHHPDNLFVNAFKIHQLALLGRHGEIADYADRLAAMPLLFPNNKRDFFTGKIEAFAWADDLNRILETYRSAIEDMGDEWSLEDPNCVKATHYVAVAHARLGNVETAIELWEAIVKNPLAEDLVAENLADVKKPVGERNGPWFFSYEFWLPKRFFDMIRQVSIDARLSDRMDEDAQREIIERRLGPCFKKAFSVFPSLESTLIELLKRGGPDGRTWVEMFIPHRQTPEFIRALLDFVTGSDGSDTCRAGFVDILTRENLMPKGPIRMWRDGQIVEQEVSGFEIHWEAKEATPPLSAESKKKTFEANEAARKGDYEKAIKILIGVNAGEPGRPSVLFNIASFYLALGDKEVYDETLDKLAEDFPDYFFVKIGLATRLVYEGKLDEAWDMLTPLHETKRMHGSEFKALTGSMVLYHLAKGEMGAARSVHASGVQVCGKDFPSLDVYQKDLERNKRN